MLLTGVALWSLATLIAPPAASLGILALCLTRLFVGLGEGLAPSSVTNIMAGKIPPTERARAVSGEHLLAWRCRDVPAARMEYDCDCAGRKEWCTWLQLCLGVWM